MKSRVSYFDKGVFRTDLTRFALIMGLYGLVGILTLAADLFYGLDGTYPTAAVLAALPNWMTSTNMWLAIAAAFSLFGDLCKSRTCNGLHAMPLRRETWFGTHFVAGMAYSLIPNTVFALLLGISAGADWYMAPLALICVTMQYLFFFGVALFSIHCAGRNSGAAVIFLTINFLSMLVYGLVESFYLPLLPGIAINEDVFLFFCPIAQGSMMPVFDFEVNVWLANKAEFVLLGLEEGFWYLLGMGAVGIVFAVLALVVYRKRQLETAGDFISAKGAKPVFLVVYTLCVAAVVQLMLGGLLLFLPLGLAVGYFTGQMLLQRKANVFKGRAFQGYSIITGVMLLTLLLTGLDPLGRVRWVPKEEKVASIGISENYFYDPVDAEYYEDGLAVTDPELQNELLRLHQAIVDADRGKNWMLASYMNLSDWDAVSVYFVYNMEDGTQVRRYYDLDKDSEVAAMALDFFSKPEYVMGYEDWDAYLSEVTKVEVSYFTFSGQQAKELLEAIKADCELGRMSTSYYGQDVLEYVNIYDGNDTKYLYIYKNCTNTINWLNTNAPGWQNY